MKVLVFGASGATGCKVVECSLEKQYSVNAFVRSPDKFQIKHSNLSVIAGDVTDNVSVNAAIIGQEAVVSVLGSGNSLRSNPALSEGIGNIVRAMETAGVRRLVYLSMLGVGGSEAQLSFLDRFIVLPLLLRNIAADHEREEGLIKQSSLDWVIVRPPRLTNGQFTGKYRSGEHVKHRPFLGSISRADVADFIVKQITDDRYVHKTPTVMN